jgi:hypothetical protein
MPFVLRTDSQTRGGRSGRFNLSKGGESKSIPLLYWFAPRRNEWWLRDEYGKDYAFPATECQFVIAAYGGERPGRFLVIIKLGNDWQAEPSIEPVSENFELR